MNSLLWNMNKTVIIRTNEPGYTLSYLDEWPPAFKRMAKNDNSGVASLESVPIMGTLSGEVTLLYPVLPPF